MLDASKGSAILAKYSGKNARGPWKNHKNQGCEPGIFRGRRARTLSERVRGARGSPLAPGEREGPPSPLGPPLGGFFGEIMVFLLIKKLTLGTFSLPGRPVRGLQPSFDT